MPGRRVPGRSVPGRSGTGTDRGGGVTPALGPEIAGRWPEPAALGWAALGLGLGLLAGAGGRLLLRRLRRGTRVPPPWCEGAVGLLWAALAGAAGHGLLGWPWVPLLASAAWFGVVAGVVDARHHRLPDALTLPALPVALLLVIPLGGPALGRAAAGAAVLGAAYLLVHAVAPAALGAGDVKLAAPVGALGAAVGWPALLLGCALAAAMTGALAVGVTVCSALGRRARVPTQVPGVGGCNLPDPAEQASRGEPGRSARRAGSAGSGERAGRAEIPHGPAMLGAAWLVAVVAAVGSGAGGAVAGAFGAG